MAKSYFEQKCRICGCDWNYACNDHDYWYAEDLCSACAEAMKPILFNTPMVQAVLEGRKTHTRRVIKPPAEVHNCTDGIFVTRPIKAGGEYCRFDPYEPYQPGEILYVRETFSFLNSEDCGCFCAGPCSDEFEGHFGCWVYKASDPNFTDN